MKIKECLTACKGTVKRARGRPLSFDRDHVLELAMHVFWRRGYEAATIHDLTAAMGINAPSLYAAFGDKEQLYLQAVERYRAGPGDYAKRILAESNTAREAFHELLTAAASMSDASTPTGCMIVNSVVCASTTSDSTHDALADLRANGLAQLRERIERGQREGDVAAHVSADRLAKFYATVLNGMAIQSRDGLDCDSLQAIIDTAMTAWPD